MYSKSVLILLFINLSPRNIVDKFIIAEQEFVFNPVFY